MEHIVGTASVKILPLTKPIGRKAIADTDAQGSALFDAIIDRSLEIAEVHLDQVGPDRTLFEGWKEG